MRFELHHFYRLLKEFVEYYPKTTHKCKRLQTFAVLSQSSDLNTSNLSKTINDRNKPFFYSRDWASSNYNPSTISYSYPILVVLERDFNITDAFSENTQTCYSLEILALDRYDEDCHKNNKQYSNCKKRSPNEIFLDTEDFLFNMFAYLRDVIYIEDYGYINKNVAKAKDLTITGDSNNVFVRSLKKFNKKFFGTRWYGGLDGLHGNLINLTICINSCGEFNFDSEFLEMKVGYDRGCC